MKNYITRNLYKQVLKRIFFRLDPERVHDHMSSIGRLLGRHKMTQKLVSALFSYSNPILRQTILGINFPNPIGLAAGFDKNAELIDILPSVGFGFAEVGSITGEPCSGNPKPRLWRLLKSKSLVVYYGLKNYGCEAIAPRLKKIKALIPIGTSIAKTNCPETVDTKAGIDDYVKACRLFADIGDYFTINISCPNAFGGQPFTNAKSFDQLMTEIDKIETQKPIFIKLSPDLSLEEVDSLLLVCRSHRIHGFISSNLTKNRASQKIKDLAPAVGGFSGKVVEELSNKLIRHLYQKTKGSYVIIGCGGVFSAEDAYQKIRLGASLIQLITGMIYEGPQLIGEINRGLVRLLAQDGFRNISEAVGAEYRVKP